MLRCGTTGVEAVEASSRHVFARHTHDQFGIGVIHQGAQAWHSDRRMVEAGPGDAITVNPGEVHDGSPIGDGGRSWRILYLTPAVVADTLADLGHARPDAREFARPVIQDVRVARCFHSLFAVMTAGGDAAITALRREELLLTLLAGTMPDGKAVLDQARGRAVPAAIAQAQARIDDDPAAPVSLAELAEDSGLSRFQLLRGFARATGLTPHAYQVQRRVGTARRLIAGGLALADAAVASGFADQSHMTRLFIRAYGLSPGAYARAAA